MAGPAHSYTCFMSYVPETRAPIPTFHDRASTAFSQAAVPQHLDTLMLNVGLRCEAACPHCHHACSPQRTETMSPDTMSACLDLADRLRPALVDVTGGEPELWPELPALLAALRHLRIPARVRTNLVALTRPAAAALPLLLADTRTGILASLPGLTAEDVGRQRGAAAWTTSLRALSRLNGLGYGSAQGDSDLRLDIAYNPPLGQSPPDQEDLEGRFRDALASHEVVFDRLLVIANVPIGRFGDQLRTQGTLRPYLTGLVSTFNADVVPALACRHGLEVAWDGSLWDCDFNLAAGHAPAAGPRRVEDLLADPDSLEARRIGFGPHCYACTAGTGSG